MRPKSRCYGALPRSGRRQDAGYTIHVAEPLTGATCIAQAGEGAMGDHFANGGLLLDGGVIDAVGIGVGGALL